MIGETPQLGNEKYAPIVPAFICRLLRLSANVSKNELQHLPCSLCRLGGFICTASAISPTFAGMLMADMGAEINTGAALSAAQAAMV